MRNPLFILTVGASVVALLLVGCGGSGDDTVSKPAFLKQADAACSSEQRKLAANQRGGIDKVVARSIAALRRETTEIKAIGAPAGDRPKIDAILDQVRRTIALAQTGSPKSFAQAQRSLFKAEELADSYGLKRCLLAG